MSCLRLYLLALASLLLCPLVSYAGPPLGLFWASPGPLLGPIFGPPEGHFEAPGGSWGSKALLGLFRAAPGQPLGRSSGTLGAPWGHSWRLLGLSWPALGPLLASLGPSWRLLGPPLGRLGRLLTAESEFSRNPVKTVVFAWFLHDFGPLGALLAALGWLLGRPKWSWVALGPS